MFDNKLTYEQLSKLEVGQMILFRKWCYPDQFHLFIKNKIQKNNNYRFELTDGTFISFVFHSTTNPEGFQPIEFYFDDWKHFGYVEEKK